MRVIPLCCVGLCDLNGRIYSINSDCTRGESQQKKSKEMKNRQNHQQRRRCHPEANPEYTLEASPICPTSNLKMPTE